MRGRAALAVLLVVALFSAGCTRPDDDADDGGTGDGGAGNGTGTPPPDDPNAPAPPTAQRVDDPDDVDRPGEYALLPRATPQSDAQWSVPSWTTGDTWRYRHHIATGGTTCDPEMEDRVLGTDTVWDVPVYALERVEIDCSDGREVGTQHENVTQADLVQVEEDGYIEHTFVFPLEDGRRWVYARSDGRGGTSNATALVRHEPEYLWPGTAQVIEAWRIVLTFEGEGNVEQRYWLGVDQKNVVRREIWADSADGVPTMFFSTTLVAYTPG